MINLWIAVVFISIALQTVEATWPRKKTSTPPSQFLASSSTPTMTAKLSDYAPKDGCPSVPTLLTEYIPQIEQIGFKYEGLYRVSGLVNISIFRTKTEVDHILNHYMRTKVVENVGDDINVLASVLKMFLRKLDEPILTTSLRETFLELATTNYETEDTNSKKTRNDDLKQLIWRLPKSNRDTLAYLMLHLKRICATTPGIGPSKENLIMLFIPSIFGDVELQDLQEALNFQKKLNAVFSLFLKNKLVSVLFELPMRFYESILEKCMRELIEVSRTRVMNKRKRTSVKRLSFE
ncbi:hypothetical protein HZS_6393 [Henneguya salminicola]|nr:hypothetical protein HZS_6393 [Henneguya salminicola]